MPIRRRMQVQALGIDIESVAIGTYQILEHSHLPTEEAIIKSSSPNV